MALAATGIRREQLAGPVYAVYLLASGAPVRGRALIRGKQAWAMLRVFDADERLTHWQYVEPGLDEPIINPRDRHVDGLVPPARSRPAAAGGRRRAR